MRIALFILACLASTVCRAESHVFIETPTTRYTLSWCALNYTYVVQHGSRFETRGACKQAASTQQQPAWTPTPHPDGWTVPFDSHVSLQPVGDFNQCELIDYRRSPGLELLMIQCLDDPSP